jgi:hypothetical protein
MSEMTERHEVRVRGRDRTIVFIADSKDGRLVIRQEPDGGDPGEVCALTLSNPEELRAFFTGLRRIVASLGYLGEPAPQAAGKSGQGQTPPLADTRDDDRDALVAQARQKNPQAVAPWSSEEEQEVRKRHEAGESIPAIARARKRSPRAIELRLQRMGVLPPEH